MSQEKSKPVNDRREPQEDLSAGRVIPLDSTEHISDQASHAETPLQHAALEEAEGEETERDLGMD